MLSDYKFIVFDANSLLKLLVHYSEGKAVPLDAELKNVAINPLLNKYLQLTFETHEDGPQLQNVRYDGKKIMTWTQGTEPLWKEYNETPKRQ